MKRLCFFGLLLAVLLGNSGAGCSKKDDDPQSQNLKLLVGGLWEVTRTHTVTKSDNVTLGIKKGALGLKFYADGKLETCSFGSCAAMGRWEFMLQSQGAGTGNLTVHIDNPDTQVVYGKKLEGALEISTDNLIRWIIKGNPIGNTDATEIQWSMERSR